MFDFDALDECVDLEPPKQHACLTESSGPASHWFSCSRADTQQDDNTVLVLLRGEAFRDGSQFTRNTQGSTHEQLQVFTSIKKHLLEPLEQDNWKPMVLVDAVFQRDQEIEAHFREMAGSIVQAVSVRVSSRVRMTQGKGIQKSIMWALESITTFCFLILCRVDLIFKDDVPLPYRDDMLNLQAVLVPWREEIPGPGGRPRVADTFFVIPRHLVDTFSYVARMVGRDGDLHDIADHMERVSVLYYTRHDSDSAKGWNPLYTIAGRPVAKPKNDGAHARPPA